MGLIGLFTTAFIVGLSGALMPGPLTVLTIRESHRRGFYAGPLVALGHSLLEILIVIALSLGLSSLVSEDLVMVVIGSVGGIMLIFMGMDMIREAWNEKVLWKEDSTDAHPRYGPILSGVIASISNPYWTIWWFTIGASYLLISLKKGIIGPSLFYSGHILADFLWLSLIALGISQGKKVIKDNYYRALILICGLFLIGLAGWFIHSSITTLLF